MLRFLGKKPMVRLFSKDQDLDPAAYFFNRSNFVESLRKSSKNPFPHKFEVSHSFDKFNKEFSHLTNGQKIEQKVSVAGRVVKIRDYGKLVFLTLQSNNETLQVMADVSSYQQDFENIRLIHRGDIVGVQGLPCRSSPKDKQGSLSVLPFSIDLLSYCLHMLPGHGGIKLQETRFRQRYLDLITNQTAYNLFLKRSATLQFIRTYLANHGFLEVETPMMNLVPGGAAAKPFRTFHNDLSQELFMRISPELYLKQLIIGGYEKVFEIGKQFRNESIDQTHNPEFTTCELYWAYADYNDLIGFTESFLSNLVLTLNGSHLVKFDSENGSKTLDFSPPFKRIFMIEELQRKTGELFPEDFSTQESEDFLKRVCQKFSVFVSEPQTAAKMIDKLCGKFIEPDCVNPTFIMDHPQVMSPLAKPHRSKKSLSERFELFANSQEICNAYTELNDPAVQREMFVQQAKIRAQGDDEAQILDEDFCKSLEYGLPPTAGWGLGIDRLVMFLCNKSNIKEVLLFPAMKPK